MSESFPPVYEIIPSGPVHLTAKVPGSKSVTNRALLIAGLTSGTSTLTGALDSEDTRIMADALKLTGVRITAENFTQKITVMGPPVPSLEDSSLPTEIYVGNSGTTARFLTAALPMIPGSWRIFGKERMHARPIGDLLRALTALGADVISERGTDAPPILIRGKNLSGGEIAIKGNVSSQFLSGLLMAAPLACGEIVLVIEGEELVSRPYVEMTLAVMKSFGAEVIVSDDFKKFTIPAEVRYCPTEYAIEPDASAASYFFALPAILGGEVTIRGLSRKSLQGDVGFVDLLERMGCVVRWGADEITVSRPENDKGTIPLVGIDADMKDISDTVQTLSVVALFAETPTRIRNVAHIRGKETDRIAAVVTELRKFGIRVDEFEDGLEIFPDRQKIHGAKIATYDDHRMAMSFSLAGLAVPGVVIENPGCVVKTYPRFFEDLKKAAGEKCLRE